MAKKLTGNKSDAWREFSRYIRVKECIKARGLPFVGYCITCGRPFHIRYLQAGHCPDFAGRGNLKLFCVKVVFPQCRECNEIKNGDVKKYRKVLLKKYSQEYIDKLKRVCRKTVKLDYDRLAVIYKKKTKELLRPFGYSSYEDMLRE